MNIPKYVIELMERAKYNFDYDMHKNENYAVGYSINIEKRSAYAQTYTLKEEMERLKKWVERQPGGEMHILYMPDKTHYCKQSAIVTIFDPVMKYIEQYIPKKEG